MTEKPQPPATPELDRRSQIMRSGASNHVQDFWEWLDAQGYVLAKWGGEGVAELHPVMLDRRRALEQHFGLDGDKLEAERRALLAYVRALQDWEDEQAEARMDRETGVTP